MVNLSGDFLHGEFSFLSGGGNMAKLTIEHNWETTALGPPENWPQELRTLLSVLFRQKLPSFLFWGSELLIFYNDPAYSLLETNNGQGSGLLGLSAKNILPAGWTIVKQTMEKVFETGESILVENTPLLFFQNGREKTVKWTCSFTFLSDKFSGPGGVLVTAVKMNEREPGVFEDLKEHASQLDDIIDAAELGTWNVDTITDKIILNSRTSEWFGLTGKENTLSDFLINIVEKDRQSVIEEINEALRPGSDGIYQKEYSVLNPQTNQKRRLLAKGKVLFNHDNIAYRFSGILQDITESYLLLEKLKNTEERLLLAIETSELGMWEFDMQDKKMTHSPKLAELLGYEKSTVLSLEELNKSLHPEDSLYLVNDFMPQLIKEGRMQVEYRIVRRNGDIIWVRNHSKVIRDENGVPVKLIGTLYDITEHKEQQLKTEESEKNLWTIVQSGPFALAIYSAKNEQLEMINQAWVNLFGKGKHLIGKKYLEIFPEYKNQPLYTYFKEIIKTGKNFNSVQERVEMERNGRLKTFYLNFTMTAIRNSEGKVIRIINSAVDVTESVLAKIKIEKSEAGFRLLADSMPQLVWSANSEGKFTYLNQAVFNFTGLSRKKLSNHHWLKIVHEKDLEKTTALLVNSLKTGDDFIVEHRLMRFDGQYRWQLSRAVSLKDRFGNIQIWIGTSTDIQEIKEQEELKDLFISMASHELKTPITSLKAYVQILLNNYSETEDLFLLKSLKIADKQIIKLTNLISELLDISKIKSGKLIFHEEEFYINELIAEAVEEFSMTNPDYTISFTGENNIKVKADIERIGQVINNFLSNAIKYSPDSKRIDVNCKIKNREVEVNVVDYGIGISKVDMPKIFDRFFRGGGIHEKTIPGFGIGLYIAEEIIRRHGGLIGGESEPGEGSRFYFTLPVI